MMWILMSLGISQVLTVIVMFAIGVWKINWNKILPIRKFKTFDERDQWM